MIRFGLFCMSLVALGLLTLPVKFMADEIQSYQTASAIIPEQAIPAALSGPDIASYDAVSDQDLSPAALNAVETAADR